MGKNTKSCFWYTAGKIKFKIRREKEIAYKVFEGLVDREDLNRSTNNCLYGYCHC